MSIDNQQYQPGDVVNGHRLSADGTAWEPIAAPAPPAEAIGEQVNWFARHKVLTAVGGGAAALLLIAGIANGGSNGDNVVPTAPAAEDTAGDEAAAPAQPAEPAEAAPVLFDPVTYTGSGDTILDIEIPATDSSHVLADFQHTGDSNFVIWSLDANLEEDDLVANGIGNYTGQNIVTADTGTLMVEAQGDWSITFSPIATAETFDTSISGSGERVVIYTGERTIVETSHIGESNFVIWAYPESGGMDLVANDIGNYTGQGVMPGMAVLVVEAEGDWTITVQ